MRGRRPSLAARLVRSQWVWPAEPNAATLGIMLAIFAHVTITGPLWDEVFSLGSLHFSKPAIPVIVGAVLYSIYRGLFALVSA